jgi:hypothetical protein
MVAVTEVGEPFPLPLPPVRKILLYRTGFSYDYYSFVNC